MTLTATRLDSEIDSPQKLCEHFKVVFHLLDADQSCSPGALPPGGQNVPQKCPFDLYSEQVKRIDFGN